MQWLASAYTLFISPSSHQTVASRIVSWISGASFRLEAVLQRGLSDGVPLMTVLVHNTNHSPLGQRQAEAATLSLQLTQALSIIQGVALTHYSTKTFLGRKYPLDVRYLTSRMFHSRRSCQTFRYC